MSYVGTIALIAAAIGSAGAFLLISDKGVTAETMLIVLPIVAGLILALLEFAGMGNTITRAVLLVIGIVFTVMFNGLIVGSYAGREELLFLTAGAIFLVAALLSLLRIFPER